MTTAARTDVSLGRDTGYEKCFQILLQYPARIFSWLPTGVPCPSRGVLKEEHGPLPRSARRFIRWLFPHNDVNFGTDPCWIRAYPYRQTAFRWKSVEVEARVMNHSAKPMKVQASLNLPEGWKSDGITGETQIPSRTEGRVRFHATAPSAPDRRRYVLGLSAVVDGSPVGEFAEAIVNFLGRAST